MAGKLNRTIRDDFEEFVAEVLASLKEGSITLMEATEAIVDKAFNVGTAKSV